MKIKVLYITEKLDHYRVPIFDIIAKNPMIELVIVHGGKEKVTAEATFQEIIVPVCKVGPISFYKKNIIKLVKSFDVVIATSSLRNISLFRLSFLKKRSFKLGYWGIGVRASYKHNFDSPTIFNKVRVLLARNSDAMIYYSEYARNKYIKKGIPSEKLFVMPNTVAVSESVDLSVAKEYLLFIGTLYKQKKIFILLNNYLAAYKENTQIPNLLIIGDGPEKELIKRWLTNNKLNHKVQLCGSIYNEKEKAVLFSKAIACISPGQAGLSVLSSFGYGVPFITHQEAITGGERLNIKSRVNGILYKNHNELSSIILDISENKKEYIQMGKNARNFYTRERKPEQMAKGFIDAVKYMSFK